MDIAKLNEFELEESWYQYVKNGVLKYRIFEIHRK